MKLMTYLVGRIGIPCIVALALTLAPAAYSEVPANVSTGMFITNVYDVNFATEEVKIQLWAWFNHHDPAMKVANAFEVPNAKSYRIMQSAREEDGGAVWDQVKYEVTIAQHWDISHYPFDRQHVRVILESADGEVDRVVLTPDTGGSKINPQLHLDDWTLSNFRIYATEHHYPTAYGNPKESADGPSVYSQVVAEFDMKRDGWRLYLNNFIGLFFATLLAGLVILANSSRHLTEILPLSNQIGLGTGALFSAVGASYILQSKLPFTTDFTMADAIQTTAFLASALCLLSAILTQGIAQMKGPAAARLSGRVFLSAYLAMVVWDAHLLHRAINT